MTTNTMKMFFEATRYMKWEDFEECSTFNPADSYEVCEEKLRNVLIWFSSGDTRAWRYFQAIYEDIPVQHRIPLLLEVVYQNYSVDYPSMLCMIADYVKQETPEMKERRIAAVKGILKGNVKGNGKVVLFRGMGEGSLLPRSAVSFTVSRKVAEFFILHNQTRYQGRYGGVYRCEVDVEDILYYSNERNEKEVFIIPEDIKSGLYGYNNDLGFLGLHTLSDYFPSEYNRITKGGGFNRLEHLRAFYRISPDRDPMGFPEEVLEAQKQGDVALANALLIEYQNQVREEYQQKLDDEYARYLKARKAV